MTHVRVVAADDNLFDASQHLTEIHEFVNSHDEPQTLGALDLFSGEGAFCHTCQDSGFAAAGIDVRNDPVQEDVLSRAGFYNILRKVLALVLGAAILVLKPFSQFG